MRKNLGLSSFAFIALTSLPACGGDGTATESTSGTSSTSSTGADTGTATATATDGTTAASTGAGDTSTSTGVPDPTTTAAPTSSTGAGSSTGESSTGEPVVPGAELFAPGTIATFDLKLKQPAIDSLAKDAKLYVLGDLTVTVGGEVTELVDIGVRLKGNFGSFRTLDQKAAFLLDFDRYVDGQLLDGLEKLALNNMVQDPSMEREVLGYELFRAGGVPAPRAAHAVVTVNGAPYGLYTTVEAVDNKEFLKTWYGDAKGNLYEGAYGSDLLSDLIPSFDQDNGGNIDFMDLQALVAALDAIQDPNQFVTEASKVIDLDLFLTMAATEIYLGHWDGYAWTRNNFFMYRRPSDMRWVFMPWGIDQTMQDYLDPFGGQGRVNQMCDASLECRKLLAAKFQAVVARVDELGLAVTAQTVADNVRPAAEADPRKEYTIGDVDNRVASNIDFLTNRGAAVMDQLLCTDPKAVDVDKDGYSGCSDDCDDNNKLVHPGAAEVCDLDDDNCDGQWDNDPKCPQCVKKPLPAPAVGNAAFCFGAKTWAEAEADCVKQGGHLLAIHDLKTQTFAVTGAFGIQNTDWWLGLNDVKAEGNYVWTDGTPFNYNKWAGGEPNNAGDEDCAHLAPWAGGDWNDMFCGNQRPYICKVP
jgi:hypothetical protein